jgi:hypothetical protein
MIGCSWHPFRNYVTRNIYSTATNIISKAKPELTALLNDTINYVFDKKLNPLVDKLELIAEKTIDNVAKETK